MFFIYYITSDIKSNSLLQISVLGIGFGALIYQTIHSGSFICPIQKKLFLSTYITALWFIIARYSNYILDLVAYELEDPLFIFFLGYLPLCLILILQNKNIYLEESFKTLSNYGHYDANRITQNLENLIIMFALSEDNTKYRVLLLGYVNQYQKIHDRYQDSMISFSRLKGNNSAYVSPEAYYQNLREGFQKHISSIYLEAIKKYPASVVLRISYTYFLQDFMNLKNQAFTVNRSCYNMQKSLIEDYHLETQRIELESFDSDNKNGGNLKQTGLMKSGENIFLKVINEDLIANRSILKLNRSVFRKMVRDTLQDFSDLWREIMEETPDSNKVRDHLVQFESMNQKTQEYWTKNQPRFKDSPHAMFDYGVYCIAVKNMDQEGLKYIQEAKNITISNLKLQFEPKNLQLGLDISVNSKAVAYIQQKQNRLVIQNCNLSFSSMLMATDIRLKNTNFLNLVPEDLWPYVKTIFKDTLKAGKLQETIIFLYSKKNQLEHFQISVKLLKVNEQKNYFVIQLSKNKHFTMSGICVYIPHKPLSIYNYFFRDKFISKSRIERAAEVLNSKSMNKSKTTLKITDNIKKKNYDSLMKKITEFEKSKLFASKVQISLESFDDREKKNYSLEFQKFSTNLVYVKINEVTDLTKNYIEDKGTEINLKQSQFDPYKIELSMNTYRGNNQDQTEQYPMAISNINYLGHQDVYNSYENATAISNYTNLKSQIRFEFNYDLTLNHMFGGYHKKEKAHFKEIEKSQLLREKLNKEESDNKLIARNRNIKGSFNEKSNNGEEFLNQNLENINYAEGVRIMRLNKEGRVAEIFESDDEDESESNQEGSEKKNLKTNRKTATPTNKTMARKSSKSNGINNRQILNTNVQNDSEKKGQKFSEDNFLNILKNKTELIQKIKNFNRNNVKMLFVGLAIFGSLLLVAISLVKFQLQKNLVEKYSLTAMMAKDNTDILRDLFATKSVITTLMLHKSGLKTNEFDMDKTFKNFRSRLKQYVDNINNKSQRIVAQAGNIGIPLFNENILNNRSLTLNYSATDSKNVTYKEGLTQITSAGLNLLSLDIGQIDDANADLKFLDTNLLNGAFQHVYHIFNQSEYMFDDLLIFKDEYLHKRIVYIFMGACGLIMILFVVLTWLRHKQQDKYMDIFYGFIDTDAEYMTNILENVTQDIFMNDDFDFSDEQITENIATQMNNQTKELMRKDQGSEIKLISRNKKKSSSFKKAIGSIIFRALSLLLTVVYIFFAAEKFKNDLNEYTVIRSFNWRLSTIIVAGSVLESIFKMGMRNPMDQFLNQPAIPVLYYSFYNMRQLLQNSTVHMVKNFDFNSQLLDFYKQTYIQNYCPYFDKIKKEYLIGEEQMPCDDIFPHHKDLVRTIFFNF